MDHSPPQARPADAPVAAKIGLGVAAVVCLYASLSSSTFASERGVRDAAGGVFAPDATLLAPASAAFAIWSVIYLGLLGHAVRVWLPDPRSHGRRRAVMWPAAMAMLLNAIWLLSAMKGLVWATLPVLVLMAAAVVLTLEGCRAHPAPDLTSLVLIDGTYGLYLGWLIVAAAANVAAVAVSLGVPATGPVATASAIALLVASVSFGLWAMRRFRGNLGIPLAVCWGLIWLIRARSHGGPPSLPVTLTAAVLAVVVMVSFWWFAGARSADTGADL